MAAVDPLINGLLPDITTGTFKMSSVVASASVVTTPVAQNPATPVSSGTTSSVRVSSTVLSTSSVIPTASSVISSSIISSSSVISSTSSSSSSRVITSSTTSTTSSTPVVTITQTSSVPALVSSSASKSSTASAADSSSTGAGGIGGSGLSVGALAGIIAGGVVVLIAIAVIATRSIRKKRRERRTRRRSAMMEPWASGIDDDPAWEKPRYEAPSQSFQMHDTHYPPDTYSNEPTYPQLDDPYHQPSYAEQHLPQAAYPVSSSQGHEYAQTYPSQHQHQGYAPATGGYQEYPVDPANIYEEVVTPPTDNGAGVGAGAAAVAGVGAGAAAPVAGGGLRDGSMVRVKVGFVRSLEDELAISPGQQLYLHSMYDDGWSLCEDQQANRGVVPLSCLEPWQDTLQPVTGNEEINERSQRRSSLYNNAQAAGAYLNMPHP